MLLPTKSAANVAFSDDLVRLTRRELVDQFGGVTAYTRAPAAGAWTTPQGDVEEDNLVMVEVISQEFDTSWWRSYAETLKRRFGQQSIHVRASIVRVLEE